MVTTAFILNDDNTGTLTTNSKHGQTIKHFKISDEIKEAIRKVQVLAYEIGKDFEPSYRTWKELDCGLEETD